jgi:bis(5'-nucleosidyl)-tetraphosphatase
MAPRQVKACGVLCFQNSPERLFLLMKHHDRWDLPKGHIKRGETELDCALREFEEETGINPKQLKLDPNYRFEFQREFPAQRFKGKLVCKTYVIFLGFVPGTVEITPTEHPGYQWTRWLPPHQISEWLIDPLLHDVEQYFAQTN